MKTEFGIKAFMAWLDNEAIYQQKRKLMTLLMSRPTLYDIEDWLDANDFSYKQDVDEIRTIMVLLIVDHFCS